MLFSTQSACLGTLVWSIPERQSDSYRKSVHPLKRLEETNGHDEKVPVCRAEDTLKASLKQMHNVSEEIGADRVCVCFRGRGGRGG